jgi:ubiquinone/menaquinone biosynthesis C-methylase UbiE
MTLKTNNTEELYKEKMSKKYDLSMSHMFGKFKKKAFNDSSIKNGDIVLVFCCGTGLDFQHILKKTGRHGKIVGVDFSTDMLNMAEKKLKQNKWDNVELIQADVTKFKYEPDIKFDIGICTLGMSIIPEYKAAYYNLLSHIKDSGEIIIGDMKLANGKFSIFNPLTIFLAKRYGGTFEGHNNSIELLSLMHKELCNVRYNEYFFRSYYYCVGKKY